MDNQHKHIAGYRDLSPEEVALINELKAKAAEVGALVERVGTLLPDATQEYPTAENPYRAVSIARTQLQDGFMWLIRAVARPSGF